MLVIKHRYIFFLLSGSLVAASVLAIAIFGLNLGIDFSGGTLWQVKLTANDKQLTADTVKDFFEKDLDIQGAAIYFDNTSGSFFIRLRHLSEEEHQKYLRGIKYKFPKSEELSFQVIGPAVGEEVRRRAITAVILVLAGISIYVTYAFRKVSYPIKSWKYGLVALGTLFHDVMFPLGMFAVLGKWWGIAVDINFVVGILVVMGFSVHDTIVVFDRIRENFLTSRVSLNSEGLIGVIGRSIDETMARSINTSFTLVLVLLAILFLGPISLRYFILTVLTGVVIGTYSSICIASPALIRMSRIRGGASK